MGLTMRPASKTIWVFVYPFKSASGRKGRHTYDFIGVNDRL